MDLDVGYLAIGATRRALGPGNRQIGKEILLPRLAKQRDAVNECK